MFITGGLYYYNNKRIHFYFKTGIIFYYRIYEFDKAQLGSKGARPQSNGKISPSYADDYLKDSRFFFLPKLHIGYKF